MTKYSLVICAKKTRRPQLSGLRSVIMSAQSRIGRFAHLTTLRTRIDTVSTKASGQNVVHCVTTGETMGGTRTFRAKRGKVLYSRWR